MLALDHLVELSDFKVLADGLDHPEWVAWGLDGHIDAGGEAGQLYRVSMDGRVEQFASTGSFVLGLCLDGDDNVYACDSAKGAVLRTTRRCRGVPQRLGSRPRGQAPLCRLVDPAWGRTGAA